MNLSINLEYYRTFYMVAKYGSISATAAVLKNSQPNLTRSIKNLEAALGCLLLNRSNRGITLTPEGERLYERLSIVFEQVESAERELQSARQMESGVLNLSVTEVALRCFLLPVIQEFHLHYPYVHIQIGNQLTAQAIENVREGKVDFAIVSIPQNIGICEYEKSGLAFSLLKTIDEICVCSQESVLCEKTHFDVKEIENIPLISLAENTVTAQSYRLLFAQYGCSFNPQIEAATADQILPLVKANLGIGFIPKEFLKDEQGICEIHLNQAIPKRDIYIVTREKQELSIAAKHFLNCKVDS